MQRIHINSDPVPHSWDLEHWPAHVYPHATNRARWLLRAYRQQLIAAGALSRVGREIVVLGRQYARWLEHRAAEKVADYVPNSRTTASRQTAAKPANDAPDEQQPAA